MHSCEFHFLFKGTFDEKAAETKDILGALVLADKYLAPDLFCQCEMELLKRADHSNVGQIAEGVVGITKARHLEAKCTELRVEAEEVAKTIC